MRLSHAPSDRVVHSKSISFSNRTRSSASDDDDEDDEDEDEDDVEEDSPTPVVSSSPTDDDDDDDGDGGGGGDRRWRNRCRTTHCPNDGQEDGTRQCPLISRYSARRLYICNQLSSMWDDLRGRDDASQTKPLSLSAVILVYNIDPYFFHVRDVPQFHFHFHISISRHQYPHVKWRVLQKIICKGFTS